MQTLQELGRCLNCGLKLATIRRFAVSELAHTHQTILAQWIEQQLPDGGQICVACLSAIVKCENDEKPPRVLGHGVICTGCGLSVFRKRHKVCTEEDLLLLAPWYKQLKTSFICMACEHRLRRKKEKIKTKIAAQNSDFIPSDFKNEVIPEAEIETTNLSQEATRVSTRYGGCNALTPQVTNKIISNTNFDIFEEGKLVLPGYKRASITRGICIMPKCKAQGQLIPRIKRKLVLLQTDTLLSRRASLCKTHLTANEWGSLVHAKGHNEFSIQHVEDMINMCEKPPSIIDFDRINEMPNHICKYWTGLGVEEFKELYEKLDVDTSQFQSLRNALAIHLLRKKTGDSLVRLANLFLMTTQSLSRQLFVIEKSYESLDK